MPAPIPVLVNANSGADDSGNDVSTIADAFGAHGLEAEIIVLDQGQDISALVEQKVSSGAPLIVAGGGDGTINAVASALLDQQVTLGVLPLGTLNHFARDLGIPFDLASAVEIVAQNHCIVVDAGEVNGHVFLNNSSIGLYPTIVSDREEAQKRLGMGKWPALARATWLALRDPACFNAVVCVDGEQLERHTPFIFVGNNCYVIEGFGIGRRTCLDGGELSLYVLRPKSAFGLIWLGFRALLGIGSQAGDFDAFQAAEFRVEARQSGVDVATDGEVMTLDTPVHYRIRPKSLRVLAPREGSQAANG